MKERLNVNFFSGANSSRNACNILHVLPQILHEKGHMSGRTQQVINSSLPSVLKEALSPKSEFWESSKTLKVLSEETYFRDGTEGELQWPAVVKAMLSNSELTWVVL
ncbi:hypothetical protein DPMN_073266 [Dreissena polymorpha]|uniref:Uncharacterized protein n=1 Tax=Dreissena polymorpha TaxID=45954 RepID=A0A9D4HD21_DREPO|nr:hypothetical protein DPMN_073266 [Dreissena polymorpha]